MRNIEILNIHGKNIVTNITYGERNARSFHIAGGQIYISLKEGTSLSKTAKDIEKALSYSQVSKFNSELYISDDYIDILGIRRKLVILNKKQVRTSKDDIVYYSMEELEKSLKEFALDIFTREIRKYEKIMNIPLEHKVRISDMAYAMGTNNTRLRKITLDLFLIHYSLDIIDAIIIHELAHYYEQNHSNAFYQIVYKYCPNYDILDKKIRLGVRN
jgi:predicted metal-dependent hydrolase